MVLDGPGAAAEHFGDLGIGLAALDEVEDFLLPRRDQPARALGVGACGFAFCGQHAKERVVQVGHQQFDDVAEAHVEVARQAREDVERFVLAAGAHHELGREVLQLVRTDQRMQFHVGRPLAIVRTEDDAGAMAFDDRQQPGHQSGQRVRNDVEVFLPEVATGAEPVHRHALTGTIFDAADQYLVRDQGLHRTLAPDEELMPARHAERRFNSVGVSASVGIVEPGGMTHRGTSSDSRVLHG